MNPLQKTRIFGPFYLFCRFCWRVTHKKHPIYGLENITQQPAVFVGRHQDMYGPVEMMAWIPMEFRVWTLYRLMDARECYRHFVSYTYTVRRGYHPLVARVWSAIIAPLVAAFTKSMGGIAVYRGRKEIIDTFRQSVKALQRGESILIMPERDYTDNGSDAGDMYNGFIHLAQLYFRATGKALYFYPVYPSMQDSAIYIEKPVVFEPSQPFHAERDRVVEALKKELSRRSIEREFSAVSINTSADPGEANTKCEE